MEIVTKRLRSRSPITLDARAVSSEVVTAEEFLRIAKTSPSSIKSSRVVQPMQGQKGFGAFVVEYVSPIYKTS